MAKTLLEQISLIKAMAVNILTYQNTILSVHDKATTIAIYNLMDDILLERANAKHFTMEEVVDARLMEYSLLLSKSRNTEVKRLNKLIKGGIKW